MRRRLFLVTLAVTTLLVAAFALPLAVLIREVARDRAVTGAEQDAGSIGAVLASDAAPDLRAAIAQATAGREGRLAVLYEDGTQVGDRSDADPDAVTLARAGNAFSQTVADGIELYTPVVVPEGTVVVRVRIPESDLTEGVDSAWGVLAAVALVLVAVSVIATDRLARSVTRPAADLARTSRQLAQGDTRARAAPGGPPEIAEVADALNVLADRIDELLTAERERVADLSHRLRTPLTALRLDAEGRAPELVADVDRLEAEVTEIIRAARRPLHESVSVRSDLARIVADRAAFWGALADDDGRRWSAAVHPSGPHFVRLAVGDAEAAVDVLVGNVFAHTPDGTPYAVSVSTSAGRVSLTVEDAGPGFPDFGAQGRGESGGGSTGLGLDIAASTARAAGGTLEIGRSEELGGARVTLDMPAEEPS